jgi:hypothetical protein
MTRPSRRRKAAKRSAFAVAIAILIAALLVAPQFLYTDASSGAPASNLASVTETLHDAGADDAGVAPPQPSGPSRAVVARAQRFLDSPLATDRGHYIDPSEMPGSELWSAQLFDTSDADLFNGVGGLFARCDSCVDESIVDQLNDVPALQLAEYFPLGPFAGGFGGSSRGSASSGSAGGGGGFGGSSDGRGPDAKANSAQPSASSPGGNGNNNGGNGNDNGGNDNGGNGNNNGGNGNNNSNDEIHSSGGGSGDDGQGGPSSNDFPEGPVSVPEPATLLLMGFGLSGLMASRRLAHKAR